MSPQVKLDPETPALNDALPFDEQQSLIFPEEDCSCE